MYQVKTWSVITGMIGVLFLAQAASAAAIRVRCEQRSDRAKVSVDGKDLAVDDYQAQIMSGTNSITTELQASVGDEVEFDFDSDPDDIADGATAIAANFIQGGQVTGKILDPEGATVIADTVRCRVRN